jgi:hypothetical protein
MRKKSKSTGIRPEQIVVGAKVRLKRTPEDYSKGYYIPPSMLGRVVTVIEIDDPITDRIPYLVQNRDWYVGLSHFDPAYGVITKEEV